MFRRAAASLVSTASSSSTTTTTLRRPSEVLLGSVSTTRDGVAARSASTLCVHLSTIRYFFSYAFGVVVVVFVSYDDDDDDVSLIDRSIIRSSSVNTERLTDFHFVCFLTTTQD